MVPLTLSGRHQVAQEARSNKHTAMAKLTADLVKARMDELLKNLQPFVKEHDDLVERKVELERIQSDLDTELKKDSQLFDESEAKRERDTAVEIARIQEKFLKQHQARVKVIEKNSTCDYNATRAHLQEVAEEIERNDLRRDVTAFLSLSPNLSFD